MQYQNVNFCVTVYVCIETPYLTEYYISVVVAL